METQQVVHNIEIWAITQLILTRFILPLLGHILTGYLVKVASHYGEHAVIYFLQQHGYIKKAADGLS